MFAMKMMILNLLARLGQLIDETLTDKVHFEISGATQRAKEKHYNKTIYFGPR